MGARVPRSKGACITEPSDRARGRPRVPDVLTRSSPGPGPPPRPRNRARHRGIGATTEVDVRVLGIDEAGRGCVLGALVVGAFVSEASPEALRAAGANDSKRLSAKRRDTARGRLAALGTEGVRLIPATAIDSGNLNALEEDAIVSLVVEHRPDLVILDALGPVASLGRIVDRLAARWRPAGLDPRVTIAPKADATHPVCGAASIVAKTTRDALLAALDATHGPLGSGYPSDPVTRAWLAAWATSGRPWPDFVRTRWGTVRDLSPTTPSA